MFGSVLVYAFCFQVPWWMPFSPMGAQPLGFAPLQPFGAYLWQAYVQPGDVNWLTPGMHRVAVPSTALSRGSLMPLNQLSPSYPKYKLGQAALAACRVSPNLSAFLAWWGGVFFSGYVPSNDTVDSESTVHNHTVDSESVVDITPGDSGVVIGYQVDEFTHTWSAEWFVAHSHIYPGFTGKVSLTYFPLEPGCKDYSFLDQAVAD